MKIFKMLKALQTANNIIARVDVDKVKSSAQKPDFWQGLIAAILAFISAYNQFDFTQEEIVSGVDIAFDAVSHDAALPAQADDAKVN